MIKKIKLNNFLDDRGKLSVLEGTNVPFEIKRIFWVENLIAERGNHAHRFLKQFIVALKGDIKIHIINEEEDETFILYENECVYIPILTWVVYSIPKGSDKKSICLVLCSQHYNNEDVIENYEKFKSIIQ